MIFAEAEVSVAQIILALVGGMIGYVALSFVLSLLDERK